VFQERLLLKFVECETTIWSSTLKREKFQQNSLKVNNHELMLQSHPSRIEKACHFFIVNDLEQSKVLLFYMSRTLE
jgi:hypothetical protein